MFGAQARKQKLSAAEQLIENMSTGLAGVPLVSQTVDHGVEMIDAPELAARWKLPESWIRAQSRERVVLRPDWCPSMPTGYYGYTNRCTRPAPNRSAHAGNPGYAIAYRIDQGDGILCSASGTWSRLRPLATCHRTARCSGREKTLDVAKQVSQLQVSQLNVRRELCRLMLGRHLCSRPDACPF